jgi:hypothetical protein
MKQQHSVPVEQMDQLLAFLPAFNRPARRFVEGWTDRADCPFDTGLPVRIYEEDVRLFIDAAAQPHWCDRTYNPQAAAEMFNDDRRIGQASLDEIKSLLTYCVRGERFSDGHWEHMLNSGKIVRILERLQVLREQGSG